MTTDQEIKLHPFHVLAGPHRDLPIGFLPLRLLLLPQRLRIEIARPLVLVGRHSAAELRLAFPQVSRRHCRFAFEHGQWRVYDLNSMNGVFVNDERVVETTLYARDVLLIGGVRLMVEAATPVPVWTSPLAA